MSEPKLVPSGRRAHSGMRFRLCRRPRALVGFKQRSAAAFKIDPKPVPKTGPELAPLSADSWARSWKEACLQHGDVAMLSELSLDKVGSIDTGKALQVISVATELFLCVHLLIPPERGACIKAEVKSLSWFSGQSFPRGLGLLSHIRRSVRIGFVLTPVLLHSGRLCLQVWMSRHSCLIGLGPSRRKSRSIGLILTCMIYRLIPLLHCFALHHGRVMIFLAITPRTRDQRVST